MAKGQQRGNREAKKPKKEKPKHIAAAPQRSDLLNKGVTLKPAGDKRG